MKGKQKFNEIEKFDADLQACTQCGYCTFWCPLYQEEPLESSVARGKVAAIRTMVAEGKDCDSETADRLNRCMLCLTCAEHCPSQTSVPNIILAARADRVDRQGLRFPYNIVFRWLLPRGVIFGRLVKFASWFQWLFLPKTEGTIRHLSFFLSALGKGRRIPQLAPKFLKQQIPVINKPPAGVATRMRVGYFIGCSTNFIFPDVGRKIIGFLNKNGVEVVVPASQGCCGAPVYLGAGDFVTGRKMAAANAALFADLDYVITGCGTCASALKDYHKFLADSDGARERFAKFGDKVKEISQFLVDILQLPATAYKATPVAQGKKVTFHDSCHLNRYLGIKEQPRQILKSIEGLTYEEMVRADWCCGMAGTFSIYYYDLSRKIADKKMATIKTTGADIVATGCPGCMMQLIDNTMRHEMPVQVKHIIELFE